MKDGILFSLFAGVSPGSHHQRWIGLRYSTKGTQTLSWGRSREGSGKPGSDHHLGIMQVSSAVFAVVLAELAS